MKDILLVHTTFPSIVPSSKGSIQLTGSIKKDVHCVSVLLVTTGESCLCRLNDN